MKRIGKLTMAAMLLVMLGLALSACEKPDQPGDTGGGDKSRNEITR
ncbi:MAG: hypothetical protein V1913_07775 [Fibrobacterota bacterium]